MDKNKNQESLKLAGRVYQTEDYQKDDQLSSGLATTHEQFSDAYTEGEIMATVETEDGMEIEIPRKGYQ